MDIHKPKAAHSVREFLIEIGTIICGILIALGLEQGIEWVHWREKEEVANGNVTAELQELLVYATEAQQLGQCSSSWVDAAEGAIRRHDAAALQRLYDSQAPFNPRNWRSTAWQAIMSTQIADHMDKERLARYSFLFPGFEDLRLMLPPMIDARAEVLSGRLGGGWDVGSERAQLATAEKLRSQLKLYATIAWTENRIAKEAPKYPPWLRPSSISKGLADCQAAASWAEVRR